MTGAVLFAAAFLACAVEAVEATTVVLAAGVARGWRAAWRGVVAGVVVLAAIVAALGPAISAIPIGVLRLVVGGLLLVFGLGWLRKAILRASGHKALHDEATLYERYVAEARAAGVGGQRLGLTGGDPYAFTLAFKAVVLEGLEVAFIVVTFGANARQVPLAAGAALAAIAVVVALGAAVRAPLARVPENTMKFVVGIMLSSFGTFWGAEGAGARWPGSDASLAWLIPAVAVLAVAVTWLLRTLNPAPGRPAPGHAATVVAEDATEPAAVEGRAGGALRRAAQGFALFWWDFVVGDDWTIALGVVVGLGAVAGLQHAGIVSWWALPLVWAVAVVSSLARAVGLRPSRPVAV